MSDVLERWIRLDGMMEAAKVTRACREAVVALEVIAACDDENGRIAKTAILRVEAELQSDAADMVPAGENLR